MADKYQQSAIRTQPRPQLDSLKIPSNILSVKSYGITLYTQSFGANLYVLQTMIKEVVTIGCVNSPPHPEADKKRDHAT